MHHSMTYKISYTISMVAKMQVDNDLCLVLPRFSIFVDQNVYRNFELHHWSQGWWKMSKLQTGAV